MLVNLSILPTCLVGSLTLYSGYMSLGNNQVLFLDSHVRLLLLRSILEFWS